MQSRPKRWPMRLLVSQIYRCCAPEPRDQEQPLLWAPDRRQNPTREQHRTDPALQSDLFMGDAMASTTAAAAFFSGSRGTSRAQTLPGIQQLPPSGCVTILSAKLQTPDSVGTMSARARAELRRLHPHRPAAPGSGHRCCCIAMRSCVRRRGGSVCGGSRPPGASALAWPLSAWDPRSEAGRIGGRCRVRPANAPQRRRLRRDGRGMPGLPQGVAGRGVRSAVDR